MLRSIRVLMVCAALVASASMAGLRPASAADFDVNDVVVVDTDFLNLRSDAGTDGRVITTLPNGMRLLITDGPRDDDGFTWYRVTVLGDSDEEPLQGWVAGDYLSLEGGSDDFDSATWIRVIDGPVNVRTSSGLDREIVQVLENGDALEVNSRSVLVENDGFTWISVLLSDAEGGWVVTDYLEALTSEPGDGGFEDALGVAIVDGPVNVRRSPGVDQTIVTTLSTGAEVPVDSGASEQVVSGDGYDWVAVRVGNGAPGYIATDFLAPLDYSPNLGSDDTLARLGEVDAAIVTDGPLNLRSQPGMSGEILLTLETGDYLWLGQPVTDYAETVEGYTWVVVDVAGETGWVAINFIEPAE